MWIIYAFLTAFFYSLKNVSSKKSLRSLDVFVVSWFVSILSFIFILPLFLFLDSPSIGDNFWWVFVANGLLSAVGAVVSTRAFKSDLSAMMPMSAFVPIFTLLTGYFILGEIPSAGGFIGVLLIVSGVYLLNIKEKKNGWAAPFKALWKNEGPRLMLTAAFIWSVLINLDKIAIQNSSPIFFALTTNLIVAAFLSLIVYKKIKGQKNNILREKKHLAAVGIFSSLAIVFQMLSTSQALVVYVASIRRFDILDFYNFRRGHLQGEGYQAEIIWRRRNGAGCYIHNSFLNPIFRK